MRRIKAIVIIFVVAAAISLTAVFWSSVFRKASPPPPPATANIFAIQYSVDQGDTWIDYPNKPSAFITAEQDMTFGLRAVKDDDTRSWPFAKPAWQKQGDHSDMYGDTVWVLFDAPSTNSHDLKTVIVTCVDTRDIKVKVMPEPDDSSKP